MTPHRFPRARWTRAALLVATALGAGACAHGPGARGAAPDAGVRAAIAAANREYARALVAGDARATAAVFAPDGEIVPTLQRGFVSGREAIEAYTASRLEARRFLDVAITTVRLGVSGDLAWETGTSSVTMQQGETAPVTVTGRYLAIWRRGPDRRWRIQAELPIADPPQ